MLLFLPASLDAEPLSLLKFRDKSRAIATRDGKGATFWDQNWYEEKEFANKPNATGRWVLVPKDVAPNTTSKNYEQQDAEIRKYSKYETAGALAFSAGIILNFLKNAERLLPNVWAWCADESGPGRRVLVGFDADGLNVSDDYVARSLSSLGRALLRTV